MSPHHNPQEAIGSQSGGRLSGKDIRHAQLKVSDEALKTQIWVPVAFAAVLTAVNLLPPSGACDPACFSLLVVCFFLAAEAQMSLLKRIERLEVGAARLSPNKDAGGMPNSPQQPKIPEARG